MHNICGHPLKVITTDARLSGWEGVFQLLLVQGAWSLREVKIPINILARSHAGPAAKDRPSEEATNQDEVRQCYDSGLH